MNVSTTQIMPDVTLTCLNTDKFKTGCLSFNLITPLCREDAAKNALIPNVLCRGTRSLPDMASISAKLDSLYGARIEPYVRKKGEIQLVGFYADFADDAFLPEKSGLMEQIASLMGEMLLFPNTHGGLLRREYVESERDQLLDRIRGIINDKRAYSVRRLVEQMCSMEEYAVPRLGFESDVSGITAQALTKHYHKLLADSPLHIFYCGTADEKRVTEALVDALNGLPRSGDIPDLGTDIRMNSLEETPRFFKDELNVTQGKLAVGFRLGECMDDPDPAAIKVFNAVYGGCVTSKLFMNVREKLSLCYFANSMVDLHKGIMIVSSGIEFDKYDAALSEIMAQLEAVKRGEITAEELSAAKKALSGAYRSISDSAPSLEEYWLNALLIGPDCPPEEFASLIDEITVDEVVKIAKGVECDAIYFLSGNEEDEE